MVMIHDMPAVSREFISSLTIPSIDQSYWTTPAPADQRRVAIVSSAGLSRRDDKPFSWHARDCRAIHKHDRDLVMTHVALDYDRTAWQQDLNTIVPLDRLEEMEKAGEIGSVAEHHYSFMGASDPLDMEKTVEQTAELLRQDNVNSVFLLPV